MIKRFIFSIALAFTFCLTLSGQSTQNDIRPGIQDIVSMLRKETTLHLGAPTGYAGAPEVNNKYYKLYKKLSRKATEKELISLTSDNSKTIVLYSFFILHARNYGGLKDIFLSHLNDSTDFWMSGGCTGVLDKVNSFMLRYLNPNNEKTGKGYLTKQEYDEYLKLISP